MVQQIQPGSVFTPRDSKVNRDMYVNREDIESRFKAALQTQHAVLIHGESGNGKTWLYKEFFSQNEVFFVVVDLNTARADGFEKALQDAYISEPTDIKTKTSNTQSFGLRQVFSLEKAKTEEAEVADVSVFERLLREVRRLAGDKMAFIVFDNLEQIIDEENTLRRLADCIIRVDNERYAAYGVRLLIVGTPGDLREIIAKHGDTNTLTNRMRTLPEVGRMEDDEAQKILRRGFKDFLELEVNDEEEVFDRILFLSDRVAEQVHSLALEIATLAVTKSVPVDEDLVDMGAKAWLSDSLHASRDLVRPLMNKKKKEVQRVDQVIYALGKVQGENFLPNDIEKIIRDEFPTSVEGRTALGISHIMKNRLATGNGKLIIQNPDAPSYRFSNPRIRMAIRASITKDESGSIIMN